MQRSTLGIHFASKNPSISLKRFTSLRDFCPSTTFLRLGTGIVWLKQNRKEHKFHLINRHVSYDVEVTAIVENRRMRRVTGVKTKEFLIRVTISDIFIDSGDLTKITFVNPTGISRTFPVSAFQLEEAKM